MKNITPLLIHMVDQDSVTQPEITVIGDLNYDYIFLSPALESGKEVIISGTAKSLAGAACVVSCGLAKLGARIYFLSIIGDDSDGSSLLKEIKNHGLTCDGIKIMKNTKSPFTLIFTDLGECTPRQVATFQGPLKNFSVHRKRYENYIKKSDAVYSCNYFLMPRLIEEIPLVFHFARNQGILTVYDANASDCWENIDALFTLINAIYPVTDVIFLNERESFFISGIKDPLKSIYRISPESKIVLIKCGAKGALLRDKNRVVKIDAFGLSARAVDSVGAGDSFQAGFLYFYIQKYPAVLCAILGSANAAASVMYPGGVRGQLDRPGLISFLRYYCIYERGDGNIVIEKKERL